MGMLSAGHLFTDVSQGAVAALIPFLVIERGISYAAAGGLMLAMTVSSSVVQPVFGYFSDRMPLHILLPIGVALGGLGVGLVGVAPSYPLIFLAIVLSGVGVAAFHPEGARFANYVSGSRRARGMSFYSVGGNAGFAIGPVLTTPLVLIFGLPGTLFLILPAALMGVALIIELPRMRRFLPAKAAYRDSGSAAETRSGQRGAFVRLAGVVVVRSFVYFGLVTFVAAYYVEVFKTSAVFGSTALSAMLFSGAVGTLICGPLADRFGRRTVLLGSMLSLTPLGLIFVGSGPYFGVVLLALIGACTVGTFGVSVVLGQEYLPDRIGLASGVTLGLSIGLGGIGAPVLGAVADGWGLPVAMIAISVLPVVGAVLTMSLPRASTHLS